MVGYVADQRVREAQGRRDQQIAQAEGQARATEMQATANANATVTRTTADAKSLLLQAEADRQAASLRGAGEASARKAIIDASGGAGLYVAILQAEAQKNWGGAYPNVLALGDKGVMPLLLDTALSRSAGKVAETK